ncbi:serine protease 33-like [Heterodontus francisci]|uniref:serine protease 33-like n=1 Tax=Heterodontus francisci TaxID=7792 RepID=UPI00355B0F7E
MDPGHGLLAIIFLSAFQWGQGKRDCSRLGLSGRIAGGTDSEPGKWPWMVSIHEATTHICGGTLISNTWVLTAAHCIDPSKKSSYTLYLGRYQQEGVNSEEKTANIQEVIRHESHGEQQHNYDIALLQLMQTITYSDYIKPVSLPTSTFQVPCGAKVWVTGWGDTEECVSPMAPGKLQEVEVEVLKRTTCRKMYETEVHPATREIEITDKMLCAGLPQGEKDACKGDSGGPLVYLHNGVWVQMGIVSLAENCGQVNRPGIYTDIAVFQKWISERVPDLQYISPTVVSKRTEDGCLSGARPGSMRGLPQHGGSLLSLLLCVLLLTQ